MYFCTEEENEQYWLDYEEASRIYRVDCEDKIDEPEDYVNGLILVDTFLFGGDTAARVRAKLGFEEDGYVLFVGNVGCECFPDDEDHYCTQFYTLIVDNNIFPVDDFWGDKDQWGICVEHSDLTNLVHWIDA